MIFSNSGNRERHACYRLLDHLCVISHGVVHITECVPLRAAGY